MVDSILENERKNKEKLGFATRNIFKFPMMRGIFFKLSLVWIGKVLKTRIIYVVLNKSVG